MDSAGSVGLEGIVKIIFCQSVLEEVAFFSGILRWLWRILANSLRIVGGLLREPDSLDRAIDIWDLGGVVRAIDNAAFLRGYADPFLRLVLCVKLLVGCCMDSIFIEGTWMASLGFNCGKSLGLALKFALAYYPDLPWIRRGLLG